MRNTNPRFNLPEGTPLKTQVPVPLDAEILLKRVGDTTEADVRPLAQFHLGQGTHFEIIHWALILPPKRPPYIDLTYTLAPLRPAE